MTRTLLLIVSREESARLEQVLEGIPRRWWNHPEFHVLYVAAGDRESSAVGVADWLEAHGCRNASVLRLESSRGEGEIQKLGFRFAIDEGFERVVLVRDWSDADPDFLAAFAQAIHSSDADVVVDVSAGAGRSLDGGAFARLRNVMSGERLPATSSAGCRAYSTRFLATVPFEIDSNDATFDTEILLQACHAGARIEEACLGPDRRGPSRQRGRFRDRRRALAAALQFRLHRIGMLCSLKYRDLSGRRYRDKSSVPYSSHARAIDLVRARAPRTVLDLGCGPGHVAQQLESAGIRVTGVDREDPLPGSMSAFRRCDLERQPLPVDPFAYDVVVLLDVVEHLSDPEGFLVALRNAGEGSSNELPAMILTTPNVAFVAVRLNLALGRFTYAERGILDITHKRLFTRSSLLRMLEDCGYTIEHIGGIGVPFAAVLGSRAGRWLGRVSDVLARAWPSLFAFQFLVVARPHPGIRQLLRGAEHRQLAEEAKLLQSS